MTAECGQYPGPFSSPDWPRVTHTSSLAGPVWSSAVVEDLHARYNEQPDVGSGTFLSKLTEQLAGAPDDTILLAAELLAVYSLPLSNQSGHSKRGRMRSVLGWLQEPVALPQDVDAAFNQGTWHGGAGMNVGIWKALAQLVEFVRFWWEQPEGDRTAALEDPWEWERLVHASPWVLGAQQEALLYLGFPGRSCLSSTSTRSADPRLLRWGRRRSVWQSRPRPVRHHAGAPGRGARPGQLLRHPVAAALEPAQAGRRTTRLACATQAGGQRARRAVAVRRIRLSGGDASRSCRARCEAVRPSVPPSRPATSTSTTRSAGP